MAPSSTPFTGGGRTSRRPPHTNLCEVGQNIRLILRMPKNFFDDPVVRMFAFEAKHLSSNLSQRKSPHYAHGGHGLEEGGMLSGAAPAAGEDGAGQYLRLPAPAPVARRCSPKGAASCSPHRGSRLPSPSWGRWCGRTDHQQHGGIPLTPKSNQKTRALSFVAAR